jgi:micrococcal nuclease
MQLQDSDERAFYEDLAVTDSLSVKRLSAAIQGNHYLSALEQAAGKPIQLPRPSDPSYLYKAEPHDIIDADTLLLDIDLGFETIRRQRIRLARIDAPDRDTAEGARARRYVREQLAVARSIVLTTVKTDLHGRYVAHVFYALNNRGIDKTFLEGRYLNQELIDKGHAKAV